MPPARPDHTIWTHFEAFSPLHWVTAGMCVALIAGACVLGRRWRDAGEPRAERRLRHGWAWLILLMQIPSQYYYFVMHWDIQRSLPLHVCDLALFIAAGALLSEARWPRTMLYFWGLGLSTQGFVTPVITEGMATGAFWYFWINHLQIIGSAIYLIVVMRYRPTVRDLGVAAALSFVYVACIIPFDVALGVNYGYVGSVEPRTPTLIQRLGPWPGRLGVLALIVASLFVVMWLVWPAAERIAGPRRSPDAADPGAA